MWFAPFREQAGAQKGTGCIKHIVTWKLLIDYALWKKKKLFVVFVDFSKAYDRIDRFLLLGILRKLGCGVVMLSAIAAMYASTRSILGTAVVTAAIGVRQGSPISGLLFVVFINELVRKYKNRLLMTVFGVATVSTFDGRHCCYSYYRRAICRKV